MHSQASPAPTRSTLLEAARRATAAPPGRVALHLAGLPSAAHRRRVLKVLLQDAAQAGGGQVFETTDGAMLLLGAQEAAAARASQALGRLAGPQPVVAQTWRLPQDAAPLLAWVEGANLGPGAAPPAPSPSIAGLDALLAGLRPDRVFRRQAILRLGQEMALPGRRLVLSAAALTAELGPLAEDADLRRHAEDALARLLPRMVGTPGPLNPPGVLLLPLPAETLPGPAPRPGLVGVLPLHTAANPEALAERRAALAELGWGLAIAGLDATALPLLQPEHLAADWLLLQWSPALARCGFTPGPAMAGSCILGGTDAPEALAWGMAQGITRFAGPHVETVLASARLTGCREAGECTQRQCGERAAATAPAARTGCRNLALLDATLPLPKAATA